MLSKLQVNCPCSYQLPKVNTLALCSGEPGFESWPDTGCSDRFLVIFLSSSWQILILYLKVAHVYFFPFQSCCLIWTVQLMQLKKLMIIPLFNAGTAWKWAVLPAFQRKNAAFIMIDVVSVFIQVTFKETLDEHFSKDMTSFST